MADILSKTHNYSDVSTSEHRRRYAQVFTPERIASFMAQYVLGGSRKKLVHDPAFGLGIFKNAVQKLDKRTRFTGNEIDKLIFEFVRSNHPSLGEGVRLKDYLYDDWNLRYDGIICNPPYLKFHDFDISKYMEIFERELKFKPSGFTNIYGLFIIKSLQQLNENGRMAYIVPSEFMNSDYGVSIKRSIVDSKLLKEVIIIQNDKDVFTDAMTTSCVLLFDKENVHTLVKFRSLQLSQLPSTDVTSFIDGNEFVVGEFGLEQLDPSIKWRKYYEESANHNSRYTTPLSHYARVSRGIATGANDYFSFAKEELRTWNLTNESFIECITKATDVNDLFFTRDSFNELLNQGKKVLLFDGTLVESPSVDKYVEHGEAMGIHERYLTSKRKPWYSQEAKQPADIWVGVFARGEFKFIMNEAGLKNLTTFHGIYLHPGYKQIKQLLFLYLLTPVARELLHTNRRVYGNGLDKFEPKDIENAQVCNFDKLDEAEMDICLQLAEQLVWQWRNPSVMQEIVSKADGIFRPLVLQV